MPDVAAAAPVVTSVSPASGTIGAEVTITGSGFAGVTAVRFRVLIGIVCWLSLVKTIYSGVMPSLLAEIFPIRTRSTGMALSYNISVPIFGGFAPFISTWLIEVAESNLAPSFYLIFTALVSLGALVLVRNRLHLV